MNRPSPVLPFAFSAFLLCFPSTNFFLLHPARRFPPPDKVLRSVLHSFYRNINYLYLITRRLSVNNKRFFVPDRRFVITNKELFVVERRLSRANKRYFACNRKLFATNKELFAAERRLSGTNKRCVVPDRKVLVTNKELLVINRGFCFNNRACFSIHKDVQPSEFLCRRGTNMYIRLVFFR
jgi:hypothetical protein